MAAFRAHLLVLVICVSTSSATTDSISYFDTEAIISAHGYPSETHHVTTSDGYILELHRIPHGKGQSPSADRPVVFLMHGLTAASNAYILLGPQFGPAYNLADGGFDIWMGNARGNRYSRFHVTLNPDDSEEKLEFFDFSFEEIATLDLPATIDYILQYTGHEHLHYIGHSQGGTTFFILNSMLPEYNAKIKSAHLLAGVGYMNYFPNSELAALAVFTDLIYNTAVISGFVEVFPPESPDGVPAEERLSHCTGDDSTAYMCELVGVKYLMRLDTDTDALDSIFANYMPAGAALKQIAHYGQHVRDKSFRRWSYSAFQNMAVYGSRNPPVYDLSLITINTTMHYTVNDSLLDERDVLAMAEDMPNTSVRKVARESFLHEDFVGAIDAKELVTDYIVEAIRRDSGLPSYESGAEQSNQNPESEVSPAIVDPVIETSVTDSAQDLVLNNIFKMYLILLSFVLIVL